MYDSPVMPAETSHPALEDHLAPLRSMLGLLEEFAGAGPGYFATHNDICESGPVPMAARYAAANSITRRHFDALLREAEATCAVGLRLIGGRSGRADLGTAAAARFLGKSVSASIRRLENLVALRAA